jgi:hypothetical protein
MFRMWINWSFRSRMLTEEMRRESSGHIKGDRDEDSNSLPDEWEVALVATSEKVTFAKQELLLDSQSSVDIIGNADLIQN